MKIQWDDFIRNFSGSDRAILKAWANLRPKQMNWKDHYLDTCINCQNECERIVSRQAALLIDNFIDKQRKGEK